MDASAFLERKLRPGAQADTADWARYLDPCVPVAITVQVTAGKVDRKRAVQASVDGVPGEWPALKRMIAKADPTKMR